MHCPDVEWSRDNTIRPLASVSVTLSRVVVSDRAHLPQCLNVHYRFFFKTFFVKKSFLFKLSNRDHLPHCFFPLPPLHFQALSAFVFSSSNAPTNPASSSLMEKKLSRERTLVKRKPPRFSIFLPINLQTLTFRLMKTFPFKGQPANKIVSMFPVTIPNKKVSLQKLRFPAKTTGKNLQRHLYTVG